MFDLHSVKNPHKIIMEYDDQIPHNLVPQYECLLLDVDDTLYPRSSGLAAEVTKNIEEYMVQKLGIETDKVPELCLSLYKYYGTTMAGLLAIGYDFDPDDFHSFVHGRLPYSMLKPDPVLRNLLLSLPIRKVVFTNADQRHATRVLNRLGLEDCFERIICFETLNPKNDANSSAAADRKGTRDSKPGIFTISEYMSCPDSGLELPKTPVICKPFEEAFKLVFEISNINPQKTVFFDDSLRNLQTSKSLNLHTVWVGTSHRADGVDHALESIHNIKEALPELWESDEKSEDLRYRRKVAVETTVRA